MQVTSTLIAKNLNQNLKDKSPSVSNDLDFGNELEEAKTDLDEESAVDIPLGLVSSEEDKNFL
ncbi:MAG: hypothetical protein CL678_13490, partial [Bdellovibrionaceae bacterium]|nr:hypothetical protein [Pseudobdellovibrionaceae bacterium]